MIINKSVILFITFLLVISFIGIGAKNVGDNCVQEETNTEGRCTLLSNCQPAINNLIKTQIPSQLCGFTKTYPVVCCPINNITTNPNEITTNVATSVTVGMKSLEKCKEYAKLVFVTKPEVSFLFPEDNKIVDTCAIKATPLIVGGNKVTSREFPHIAEVGYDSQQGTKVFICLGSLISEKFVITAGRCLSTRCYNGPAKYVRLGGLNPPPERNQVQTIHVAEIIKHPKYKPSSFYNDIGLLKLAQNAKFTQNVRPICLNTQERPHPSFIDLYKINQHDYFKQIFNVIPHEECNKEHEKTKRLSQGIDNETQICASSKKESTETCMVDFGNPLQVYHDDVYCMYKLIGVSSFGKNCYSQSTPVYTRISYYIDWIEKIIWA